MLREPLARFFTHRYLSTRAHARAFFAVPSPCSRDTDAENAAETGRVLRVATRASVRHDVCTMISQPALKTDTFTVDDLFSCTIDKVQR